MTRAFGRSARSPRSGSAWRDRTNLVATGLVGAGLVYVAFHVVRWAVVLAVWTLPPDGGSALCRDLHGEGACWAVVGERARFMLFGVYPFDEQWRPLLSCLLFIALYLASAVRAWWTRWLLGLWILVPAAAVLVLGGGAFGLADVPSELWGGLPLTFLLSTVGCAAALPPAVALALGRRCEMPAIRVLCGAYIELVRGVPFITVLFMASVMFPLFVAPGLTVDKLLRAQIAFVMFAAAYLAEVVRAGLAAVPKGQYEAAASVGLTFWPATLLVVLPQALRVTIPALVNTFIGVFKDTSLVAVIGLFDLLGTAKAAIVEAKWVGFGTEVYVFVGAIYFACCYAVSRYSQQLERVLATQARE